MSSATDFFENSLVDGLFRTGTAAWAASTAYSVGQTVFGNNASAPGKVMECTVAGTSAASQPTWPAVGSTVADNTVTWKAWDIGPPKRQLYVGLFTANPSDTGGGTEVTGGSYARVQITNTNANWAATNSAGSTAAVSTGTGGTTSNNNVVTFATPTANWGTITAIGLFDSSTGGNLLAWAVQSPNKTVNNGDSAPTIAAAALTYQVDN